jgi:Uma2 family endonuclease
MEKIITDISQLDLNGIYTYADYLRWQLEERIELIKGKIFKMSPAPTARHQKVSREIMRDLLVYFDRNSPCQIYSAPFDVRLLDKSKSQNFNQEIYTVVQPDISVICDKSKIDEKGCIGAPDLIIEILSPGNSKKEMKIKYALYEESGVREYWVVYPSEQSLFQFILNEEEKFVLKAVFTEDEVFNAHIFPDLQIDLAEVFAE